MSKGRDGLPAMAGIPVRQFRLFVALKFPMSDEFTTGQSDIRGTVTEILKGAHLQPRPLEPASLIDTMRRLMNDRASLNNDDYDEEDPINRQIIFSDTEIAKDNRRLLVGDKVFRCATVKKFPLEVSFLQTNEIFGGISGLVSNSSQVITPFLCTVNIVFADMKAKLHAKCNLVLSQQAFGSFAPSLARKKEENLEATDKIERGIPFVRVMPILWVWAARRPAGARIAHQGHPRLGIAGLHHAVRPLDTRHPLHRGPAVRPLRYRQEHRRHQPGRARPVRRGHPAPAGPVRLHRRGRAGAAGQREKGSDRHPGHIRQGGEQLQHVHRRLAGGGQVILRELPGLQLFRGRRKDTDSGRGEVISEDDPDAWGKVPRFRRELPASASTHLPTSTRCGWGIWSRTSTWKTPCA